MYFATYEESQAYISSQPHVHKLKQSTYGTVLFIPQDFRVDFGRSVWPSPYQKKICSPIVLLCQGWTDGRSGFIGGQIEKGESVFQSMNREFLEEAGSSANFTMSEYLFSYINPAGNQMSHVFVQTTHDRNYFTSILSNFHTSPDRKAYIDEIFSITGVPLWVEGPENAEDVSWNNNVWGLPRLLAMNGGFLTGTLNNSNIVRDQLVLILLRSGVVDDAAMRRVFQLAARVPNSSLTVANYDSLLNTPGVAQVLAAAGQPIIAEKTGGSLDL
eukprot:gene2024-2733_t